MLSTVSPVAIWIFLVITLIAANLPWLSERIFLIGPVTREKTAWFRLFEWFVLYLLSGLLAFGLEFKLTGGRHSQDWEFFAVSFCLFLIFAVPGFVYRHHLRHLLDIHKKQSLHD